MRGAFALFWLKCLIIPAGVAMSVEEQGPVAQ